MISVLNYDKNYEEFWGQWDYGMVILKWVI